MSDLPSEEVGHYQLSHSGSATYPNPPTTAIGYLQGGCSHFLDGATANDTNSSDAGADWTGASSAALQSCQFARPTLFPRSCGSAVRCHIRNVKA